MEYRIRALDGEADAAGFRCGEAALDEHLRRYARQDVRRGVVRVFVATPAEDELAVVAIVVDARSPAVAAFYQHFGFVELPGQPGRWMLPRGHFAARV